MKASLEIAMNPPRATTLRRRDRSRRPTRRHFVPESLEHRYLPSAGLPGITATDPADGGTVLRAPQSFTITFDQDVVDQIEAAIGDAWSLPADQVLPTIVSVDVNQDVEIDQVGADGELTPYAGGTGAPIQETIATSTAADGTTQTQLVITPMPGDPAMQPGTYQLEVLPGTLLDWAVGSFTDPIWYTSSGPMPIAQFTVTGQGPTLAGATDLGTVGASAQSVWSTLEPSDVQSAVALYRFTLPQGGEWRVDAKALASAIGSPALPALALFGADGSVLATRDNGSGLSGSPDPELLANLPGGTYYLGVSAAGNLPGTAQGYDAITGRPGTAGVGEPAGVFELDVSATPAVPPTALVAFDLDHADPLEPSPTGMDLTFSGPVDVSSLTQTGQQETALTVVDASGKTWPISAMAYDNSEHRLSFVFDEPLPAGTYSLVVPSQGGLTDLAGNPVIGPSGDPPGVLATWTIAAPSGPADPNDLGVMWPGPENVTWSSGKSGSTTLDPGQEVQDRFMVIWPGIYGLQAQVGTGAVDLAIVASDGTTVTDLGSVTGLNQPVFHLGTGVYELRMTAEGSKTASVAWTLYIQALDHENILNNGVGQAPAQNLPVFGPMPGSGAAPTSFGGSGTPSAGAMLTGTTSAATITTAGAASGNEGASSTGFAASAVPAALLVTPATNLAGLPASDQGYVAAVGPLADGAAVALADAGRVLPAGLRYQSSPSGTEPQVGAGESMLGPEATPTGPLSGGVPRRYDGPGGPDAASARADAMALALAQADPLVRIAGWLAGRIPGPSPTLRELESPATDFGTTLLAAAAAPGAADADTTARDRGRATLAQADLGVPFALLVGTALTYRLSQPIRKWWRRHHTAHPTWPRPYGMPRAGITVPRA
jgi:methionine-rich copper-binding protein CopC